VLLRDTAQGLKKDKILYTQNNNTNYVLGGKRWEMGNYITKQRLELKKDSINYGVSRWKEENQL